MRLRKILLVHSTRSIRALIQKYIFTELSDVEIVESDSGQDALSQLNAITFNAIIATSQLIDMSAAELKNQMKSIQNNAQAPFLVISESDTDDERQELIQQGFDHIIQTRIKPIELIRKINEVCDPRSWRENERYYIPKAKVGINVWGTEFEATLINISMGGILVELAVDRPDLILKNNIRLTLKIPSPHGYCNVAGLPAKLARISVIDWRANHLPSTMQASFIFVDMDEATLAELTLVIEMAKEDNLVIE